MESRREFLQKAAFLAGTAGLANILPMSIQKALAINPEVGSTYLDAEHIVILMQENRSFDHTYGTLQGVRGFNDPRAITLPNKNKVWLQSNKAGETFAPFRLNIKDTKATWMNSLPHAWKNQVDAFNKGKHDQWLQEKQPWQEEYQHIPMTLGYYTREDIPFYYALADAFTVCDQNFCSSLTGTTPNRLFLWSGTIREEQNHESKAHVYNEDADYERFVKWKTFPEVLEENNVSWKVYQNEISTPTGLTGEEDAWLTNFGDNPLEYFEQFNVKFAKEYYPFVLSQIQTLPREIDYLQEQLISLIIGSKEYEKAKNTIIHKERLLATAKEDLVKWHPDNFEKLSEFHKNIHRKAFTTNAKDPHYRKLETLTYEENGEKRELVAPKGDIFFQFREDVSTGKLPTVSWLVAPEKFSDHPSSAWFGAWYVSEAMNILTQNPEVWKKTIFILAYDENDGYFDHIPPFVAPAENLGKVSNGIDTGVEQVSLAQELKRKGYPEKDARGGPIGLGFRVPLVVASPWSRGGNVCSEVFDHTSVLQLLEKVLSHKTGKEIKETKISDWRRTVCGDLSSVFQPYLGEKSELSNFVKRNEFLETIHKAQFKGIPTNFKALSPTEIVQANRNASSLSFMPRQEKGIRNACALPYQLYVDGKLSDGKQHFNIVFKASNEVFGQKAAGSPFVVYAPDQFVQKDNTGGNTGFETAKTWNYAVKSGDIINDTWALNDFENEQYHFCVYGPNGFFRTFKGDKSDPNLAIDFDYERSKINPKKLTGNIILKIKNLDNKHPQAIEIIDNTYKKPKQNKVIEAGKTILVVLNLNQSHHWYDFSLKVKGNNHFEKRFAGHVETGSKSFTDPKMGGVV